MSTVSRAVRQVSTIVVSVELALRSPDARHGDMIDQASHEVDFHQAASIGQVTAKDAKEAREHRLRVIEGMGDICKDCRNPIPEARRRAKPTAIRCCGCQEKYKGN